MFSSRLPARLGPSPLSRAIGLARGEGRVRIDLTETNPTVVGLEYPHDLVGALADPAVLTYDPASLGTVTARAAVAAGYTTTVVDPARVVLTASTSEAYAFLFKLLCDPGDHVATPRPSYPLFDLLTSLEGVEPRPYRLDPAGGWAIDRDSLMQALTPRTRAILVVSPNNPTGSCLRAADRDWLVELARDRQLALIADEVFADYPLAPRRDASSLLGTSGALTFTLGGLSKSAGLPQMKLAWTVISGPDDLVAAARDRLDLLADSYLSVSTPVQVAAPRLLAAGRDVQRAIRPRLVANLETIRRFVKRAPAMSVYEPEGGWSAVIRVPAILSEDQWVLRLIDDCGVLVHPGYFFDLDTGVHLVVSLLPAPDVFETGLSAIADRVRSLS